MSVTVLPMASPPAPAQTELRELALEDERIWTRRWVCAGVGAADPERGRPPTSHRRPPWAARPAPARRWAAGGVQRAPVRLVLDDPRAVRPRSQDGLPVRLLCPLARHRCPAGAGRRAHAGDASVHRLQPAQGRRCAGPDRGPADLPDPRRSGAGAGRAARRAGGSGPARGSRAAAHVARFWAELDCNWKLASDALFEALGAPADGGRSEYRLAGGYGRAGHGHQPLRALGSGRSAGAGAAATARARATYGCCAHSRTLCWPCSPTTRPPSSSSRRGFTA